MSFALIGLYISALSVVVLCVFFRHERTRGIRYGEHLRARADLFVMKLEYRVHKMAHFIVSDLVKQLGHYSFHTLLKTVLVLMTKAEKGLRNVMRVNKTLAKSAERESTTRTKLEELALHKAEHSLTEEEKKHHRDRSLNGF